MSFAAAVAKAEERDHLEGAAERLAEIRKLLGCKEGQEVEYIRSLRDLIGWSCHEQVIALNTISMFREFCQGQVDKATRRRA
jgi:hypothetical protein